MKDYWRRVYDARYFWLTLAGLDLKNRFRRSKLGLLWVCVNPLCLTAIMTAVFGTVFHSDMKSYAPYILSGILCWNVFVDSLVAGGMVIIGSEAYIRQYNHPLTIYPLKAAIAEITSFAISTLSLGLWMLFVDPLHSVLGYLLLFPALLIFFVFSWSGYIIASFLGTKYRDYPQVAGLVLQTVWYLSPVFFQEDMFESNDWLHRMFQMNPITHMLQLVRAPFLDGKVPGLTDYLYSIGFVLCCTAIAYLLYRKDAKNIIFYF